MLATLTAIAPHAPTPRVRPLWAGVTMVALFIVIIVSDK